MLGTDKNMIRTRLLIMTNKEIQILCKNQFTITNSNSNNDLFIEIKLEDQFFKQEKSSQIYNSPLNLKKNRLNINNSLSKNGKLLNQNSQGILRIHRSKTELDGEVDDIKASSVHQTEKIENLKLIKMNQNFVEKTSNESTNTQDDLKKESLIEVYSRFIGCLDSKISIGFEKHINFNDKLNNRKTQVRNSQSKRLSKTAEVPNDIRMNVLENKSDNKIDNILNFLNRESGNVDEAKKRRIKEGIFYIQSLVYCLRKNIDNLKKSKKNHEEFVNFRKELLSPLINNKKSKMVNFEVLKKVYIWKEDKRLLDESKQNITNFERRKKKMNTTHQVKPINKKKDLSFHETRNSFRDKNNTVVFTNELEIEEEDENQTENILTNLKIEDELEIRDNLNSNKAEKIHETPKTVKIIHENKLTLNSSLSDSLSQLSDESKSVISDENQLDDSNFSNFTGKSVDSCNTPTPTY